MIEDLTGGAPAPAEAVAVAETPAVATPEPVAQQVEPTPRGAVERAFAAVEKADAEPAAPVKPVTADTPAAPTGERERNPDGTFKAGSTTAAPAMPTTAPATGAEAPKPVQTGVNPVQTGAGEAPARFSADAKAAWAQAPEPVRAEVARMERELTQGIETYKADAKAYSDTYKPFAEMAKRSNLDASATLANYVNIDMLLANDFNAGIAQIFKNKGQDVRAWAAQVAGQPAPTPQPQDQTIAELRAELAGIKQSLGGVTQTVEQQRSEGINRSLEGYVNSLPEADQTLFKELDAEIAQHLREPGSTLADAFARAKQDAEARYTRMFGPRASSALPNPSPAPATPTPQPQTPRPNLQISGAPGTGSNPASRATPSSPRAAVDGAFAALGLG